MQQVADQLNQFAKAAVCHASEQHALRIDNQHIELVDRILDLERKTGNIEQRPAIRLCYGAWLGEWAVARVGGEWVGLFEPTPPRIVVNGVYCSPMDAVERRLNSDQAPTIQSLVEQWIAWSKLCSQDLQTTARNRSAWDARIGDERFVRTDGLPTERADALAAIDPWLVEEGSLEGRRILCLAAGGGMHGPLLAVAGADVTVVDFSARQLEIDRQLAKQYSLKLRTVETLIDDLSTLDDSSFDAIVQPVSTSYVRDIYRVYKEIARVLRSGGLYVGQHKQPASLQTDNRATKEGYVLRSFSEEGRAVPPLTEPSPYRESEMTEFIHTWEALVGGLCRSGFVIEDLQEPPRSDAWAPIGSPEHRARYVPPYMKIKARRISR